jgi:Xaa-Pro dipeptidase
MGAIPLNTITARQAKIKSAIQEAGVTALVLNPGPSITYLTGMHFHLSERPVTIIFTADKAPMIVLPELESAKTKNLGYEIDVITYGEDPAGWVDAFKKANDTLNIDGGKLGVEALSFRFLEMDLYSSAFPASELIDASDLVASLRILKDESEFRAMQKAVDIAQAALKATLPLIKIGMAEKEIATEIIMQLYRHGSDSQLPFSPIVASGPNSADPHAFPTERKIADGDLVVIDWGCSIDGYFSDLTRTFAIGHATPQQEKIHQVVHQANQAAHRAAKPGVTCSAVDEATRTVIEGAGYGQYFTHRTGHGLGMETHESPYIRKNNLRILAEGMSFTIEPGIYLPQEDGVRIEDDVIVTKDGLHSFSNMTREIQVIG